MRINTFLVKSVFSVLFILLIWPTAGLAVFPDRPIQVLCGWDVGSSNDAQDRAVAKALSRILKQQVLVMNYPGGGGANVLMKIKTEKADGYTIFQTGLVTFSRSNLVRKVPYDPLVDFKYLAQSSQIQSYMMARPGVPWKNWEELLQYIKKNPKKVKYATTGSGTSNHMIMEYLSLEEDLKWTHVPYGGSTEVISAILGGHVDLACVTSGPYPEYTKSGKLFPILALTPKRGTIYPDLPAITEKGYDFAYSGTAAWAVAKNTPSDIAKILEKALLQSFEDPEFQKVNNMWLGVYEPLNAEETTKAVIKDHEQFEKLIKKMRFGIYKE